MSEHEPGNSAVGDQLKKIADHLGYLEKKIDQILAQSQPRSGGFQPRRPGGFAGRPNRGNYNSGPGGHSGSQNHSYGRGHGRPTGFHKKASF